MWRLLKARRPRWAGLGVVSPSSWAKGVSQARAAFPRGQRSAKSPPHLGLSVLSLFPTQQLEGDSNVLLAAAPREGGTEPRVPSFAPLVA